MLASSGRLHWSGDFSNVYEFSTIIIYHLAEPPPPQPTRWCFEAPLKTAVCYYTACCTHLDLDILAVDDLYDAHDMIEHQAHFLTVVWWTETKTHLEDRRTRVTRKSPSLENKCDQLYPPSHWPFWHTWWLGRLVLRFLRWYACPCVHNGHKRIHTESNLKGTSIILFVHLWFQENRD